jgi:hypothetical protein
MVGFEDPDIKNAPALSSLEKGSGKILLDTFYFS